MGFTKNPLSCLHNHLWSSSCVWLPELLHSGKLGLASKQTKIKIGIMKRSLQVKQGSRRKIRARIKEGSCKYGLRQGRETKAERQRLLGQADMERGLISQHHLLPFPGLKAPLMSNLLQPHTSKEPQSCWRQQPFPCLSPAV